MEDGQVLLAEILDVDQPVARAFHRRHQLVELELDRQRVLVLRRWIRNTIRNVTIVVPVLMTSCHVSEKPKIGPVTRPWL